MVAGGDFALDMARDIADALDIGDGGAAEFHDETGHKGRLFQGRDRDRTHRALAPGPQGAYR